MARRILLADDSVTAQNMGRRILTDAGYEVATVNNGSAALKKIAESRPDIIVLDVYMPGYGGLEVCQRVKEAAETARIPVLLTVGKLEPFKPEEARRVGADAFIIKPFEATELLTALTKLEDKIVASPQPQKSGRFAKALAAVEQSTGERFGDRETGWKNRLTIPGPNVKPAQDDPEVQAMATGPARDFERSESARPVEPKQGFERPIPAGLPADITPEEIAAITAAAASFDGKSGHPAVIPEGSASDSAATTQVSAETAAALSSEPEVPAATLASATESEQAAPMEAAAATPVAAEAVSEIAASSEVTTAEEHPAPAELPATEAETDSTPAAAAQPQVHEAGRPSTGDAEVLAAIASLAPSNGRGGDSMPSAAAGAGQEVSAAATSAIAAESSVAGPRWIAEPVAVALEESALALEQEMEQASAAKVSAEALRNNLDTARVDEPQAPAPVAEAAEAEIAAAASVTDAVASTEFVPARAVASESVIAENVVAENIVSENAVTETVAVESSSAQGPEPVAKEESAFAAAAAAGPTSEQAPTVEAVSSAVVSPELSESAPVASVEAAPQREAELAAAWQNWKQIRESFVSAQPSAEVAEASAVEANAAPAEETAPPRTEEDEADPSELESTSVDAPGESTAIASIVDTMLAELRPKLVEEIAKKMNSEKKEKEKEKKKRK